MLATLRRKRNEEGFTLIELLIVIIILAILATIVIFAVGTTTKNAAVASCKTTVKTVETAIAAFKTNSPTGTGKYPTALTTLKPTFLKSVPATTITGHAWAFTTYTKTNGTFKVTTKTTATARATTTGTICKGA